MLTNLLVKCKRKHFCKLQIGCVGTILALCFSSTFAQSNQKLSTRELHYKFRDGNRWEGIKKEGWKQVSGTLELSSFICYEEGWRGKKLAATRDSVSIFVYVPQPRDLTVSVFYLDTLYFMDPYPKIFTQRGKNIFQWPSQILKVLGLSINQLDGVARARVENRLTYFPIYFSPPEQIGNKLIAEFSFTPSRAATFDFALYARPSESPIWKTSNDVRLDANESKTFYWPIEGHLSQPTDFSLVAAEKAIINGKVEIRRRHEFNICLFK